MWGWRSLIVGAAGLGLLLGLLLGSRGGDQPSGASSLSPSPAPSADSRSAEAPEEIVALRAALDEERSARIALATELEELRLEIDRLGLSLPEEGLEPGELEGPGGNESGEEDASASLPERLRFDESQFAGQELDAAELDGLRRRFEEQEMEELYLRDQAAREGWLRSRRYYDELQQLRRGLREELGDEAYDYMLYAAGRNNRVVLTDLLHSSPAVEAGLQPGDVLVRYDGERIFNTRDLHRISIDGRAGATVAVDVLRDGELLRFYLPRGPVGARLHSDRRAPNTSF